MNQLRPSFHYTELIGHIYTSADIPHSAPGLHPQIRNHGL